MWYFHRIFKCLEVILEIKMLSYIWFIPLFLLLCVILFILSVFAEFNFATQIMRIEEGLVALRINVASKRGPNDPTHAYCAKHHGLGWTKKKKAKKKWERDRRPPPRLGHGGPHRLWWLPQLDYGGALSPGCSVFFAAFCIPTIWMVIQHDFSNKSIFLSDGEYIFLSLYHPLTSRLVLELYMSRRVKLKARITRIPCWGCNRWSRAQFWMSISLPPLLFSYFRIHVL